MFYVDTHVPGVHWLGSAEVAECAHDPVYCCGSYLRDEGQLLAFPLASLFQGSKSKVRFIWLASGHHLSYGCCCTRQFSV